MKNDQKTCFLLIFNNVKPPIKWQKQLSTHLSGPQSLGYLKKWSKCGLSTIKMSKNALFGRLTKIGVFCHFGTFEGPIDFGTSPGQALNFDMKNMGTTFNNFVQFAHDRDPPDLLYGIEILRNILLKNSQKMTYFFVFFKKPSFLQSAPVSQRRYLEVRY